MCFAFFLHEATAMWDVSYAVTARNVSPLEQHVHSFLEMIPLMGLLLIVPRHWQQFLSLFGIGDEPARFDLAWKREALPTLYVATIFTIILLFELLPYLEELARGLVANGGHLVPDATKNRR
jgi:hypothetical protein